ncbi:MAG: hypothetical protein CME31_10360 [Gimesia sp.]|jgi:hypothetical protein|uniref:Uncharacterized protein n=1 Tax=Gimesia maris TaxID=122 RepID=A0A3D3RE55_9PLAN|nr:hypothetical protein [Gimesia sp.]HCO27095.1 hypothetical protein [Gimesia maris]
MFEYGFQFYCGLFCGMAWGRQAEMDKKSVRYVSTGFDSRANRGRDWCQSAVKCVDPQRAFEQVFCQIALRQAGLIVPLLSPVRDHHLNQ